ncbi:MAG: SDR family NAD(P)-dependent oxidoreductase [Anaerolineales bacterium]|nr:SDR family NAD(P)-dependent oxidoreductase [Anaerolineales bacterium]
MYTETTTDSALIWGAAGGIGRALVTQLAGAGWTVGAVARDSTPIAALTPHAFDADVADPLAVQRAVLAIAQELSDIKLWVYAAGDIASEKVADTKPETLQRILDANLTGALLTVQASLPLLAPDAHLFFIGAVQERMRLPGLSAYAAAKAGLEAFAEAFRKEERTRKITVVRPGAVNTPFWKKVPFRMPANALAPEAVAQKILEAYQTGQSGLLDM